jgi:hypothetical protein
MTQSCGEVIRWWLLDKPFGMTSRELKLCAFQFSPITVQNTLRQLTKAKLIKIIAAPNRTRARRYIIEN